MKTAFNHTTELIAAKVIRAVYTKIASNRNAPNLYVFLDVDGRDLQHPAAINYMEKKVQNLKLTTPPRGAREGNTFPAMRRLYERNAELLRRLRKREAREKWQLERAQRRTRGAMEAAVGTQDAWNRANGGLSWEEREMEAGRA
jgi:hypothetical protein